MKPGVPRYRGQASIELALAISALLLVALGAVQFGILYSVKLKVLHAAREGARYASLHATQDDLGFARVRSHTVAAAPDLTGFAPEHVRVAVPEGATVGRPVIVSVEYPCAVTIPPLNSLLRNPLPIRAQVQMRIER